MERDGVTEEDVRLRMKGQWQDSAKQDKADFILKNEGTLEDFNKNIEFILQLLKRISLS
jgi:dephospho-CoA kinase